MAEMVSHRLPILSKRTKKSERKERRNGNWMKVNERKKSCDERKVKIGDEICMPEMFLNVRLNCGKIYLLLPWSWRQGWTSFLPLPPPPPSVFMTVHILLSFPTIIQFKTFSNMHNGLIEGLMRFSHYADIMSNLTMLVLIKFNILRFLRNSG